MDAEFSDHFDERTYATDEPVHLFRPDRYGPEIEGVWMPETLWHRLRHIGMAYNLHLLPLLDGTTDPVFLNPLQVEQLATELLFVTAHVNDPLLQEQVAAVEAMLGLPSQGASKDSLGVEFP